jgi:hypothetical protein
LIWALLSLGLIISLMTGSGTNIEVIALSTVPSVNVSPEAQSTPNSAQRSPAHVSSMSSISSECMRTMRPTFTFFLVRMLMMVSPLRRVPW